MKTDIVKIPAELLEKAIFLIRGEKVMLDRDLADLYEVETRTLNQSVKRNIERFPPDFMFELTRDEILGISQFVTSAQIKFSKRVTAFMQRLNLVTVIQTPAVTKRRRAVALQRRRGWIRSWSTVFQDAGCVGKVTVR